MRRLTDGFGGSQKLHVLLVTLTASPHLFVFASLLLGSVPSLTSAKAGDRLCQIAIDRLDANLGTGADQLPLEGERTVHQAIAARWGRRLTRFAVTIEREMDAM